MNNKVVVTIITLGAIYWLCMIASLCGVAKADIIKKRPPVYTDFYTNIVFDIQPEYEIFLDDYFVFIEDNEFCTFEDYLFNEGYCDHVIPEPLAFSLIGLSGIFLLMLRRKLS